MRLTTVPNTREEKRREEKRREEKRREEKRREEKRREEKRREEKRREERFELEGIFNYHLVQQPDQFRTDQKLKCITKGTVHWLLNTDKLWALTTALGSLFQSLITHSVKKYFQMSSLNFS
ncbi:hypothetical protein DUI87_13212 [Hirundo rustica rustica]|uniref:Uncharacterized protein n=1 Tax=Hirundo rustica rustica TaxID=333673 RepID=A0A3M0KTL2_HIRRU|nr:hypothetical protein DUI87_13212 [Hirundo rustica rustica]